MSALSSVCQRVREDFGAVLKIVTEADTIVPTGDMGYPAGAKFSKQSYFVASIDYPAEVRAGIQEPVKTGTFVYLKSSMIKELSFPAKGYKAKFPDFPNQSTMDQFFDSAQFEAYRELGYASVSELTNAFGLDAAKSAPDVVARLSCGGRADIASSSRSGSCGDKPRQSSTRHAGRAATPCRLSARDCANSILCPASPCESVAVKFATISRSVRPAQLRRSRPIEAELVAAIEVVDP